jgi:lipopolysaccharide/colanic/teichoic acid biosynthesis glycosyltransferase
LKRLLDSFGGIALSIVAVLAIIIIGPIIKIKSPGPILYKQERIGQNGRHFKMFKIRSMYMDADARKQELMEQNRVTSGMMFKLDFDPRIIGNEQLPDGTRKTGIGEFIRRTSIDELPQGFNVLLNQMSLVGTRPPTVDEWEKYELHHRARLATKPGITGMWQVSGRSNITDFEEITRLDTEYIENWSIGLDIRILIKTVGTVLAHRGAM